MTVYVEEPRQRQGPRKILRREPAEGWKRAAPGSLLCQLDITPIIVHAAVRRHGSGDPLHTGPVAADLRLSDADVVVDQRRHLGKLHVWLDAVELDDLRLQLRRKEGTGRRL